MSTCKACTGRATLFLCSPCQSKLRDLLEHLPQWLTHLEEAAVGHVRLGDGGGGRTTARREPFKGDDAPPHSDPALLRRFLAAGGVNARASDQLDAVRNSITTWLRHLCDQRRVDWVTVIEPFPGHPTGFIGPLQRGCWRGEARPFIGPLRPGQFRRSAKPTAADACHWLAWNVSAIACDEAAGELLATFQDHVAAIEKVINRPVPMRYLGKCPTWNERTRKACATQLQCREGDVQVVCPTCRQTHDPNRLQLLMMNDLEREKLTIKQILGLKLPEEYQINERSLRRWRKPGKKGEPPKLKACGYRRGGEDGPLVINRHSEDDEPVYRWADVRKLRAGRVDPKVKTA